MFGCAEKGGLGSCVINGAIVCTYGLDVEEDYFSVLRFGQLFFT